MKKMKLIFLFVLLCTAFNVNALKRNDNNLVKRIECEHFELAYAKEDGKLEKKECFESYNDAKMAMNTDEDKSLVILEKSNDSVRIIDAKYALAYLDKGRDALTYIYSNNDVKTSITYMNNYKDYGATDAAYLELNYSNKAIKIRIAGVTGWIKSGEYTIIPINWLGNASYYSIDDNNIKHFYAKDIEEVYSQYSRSLGPKPNFEIQNGNYKSYDGIYFYANYYDMIDDYRLNTSEKAVNKDNPYYNYYLYLPHRTKTNYSIDDIDSYVRNVLNFKGSVYAKTKPSNYSSLYGAAEYFMYAEKMYGANALSVFSLSRNESANGTSSIAINKNNIFGHNAVDGAAYSSSTGYLDIRSSIYSHGYGYINYGYARVSDSRYHGSHFGNKNTGMNVMYASDVYWGEKAASYYYSFDKDNGMEDYNYYQLIISNTKDINVRVSPNTSSKVVYTVKSKGIPFVLLEEVHGTEYKGSDIWYKIQSDSNVNISGTLIGSNKETWPQYEWKGYLYVHSSFFSKINNIENDNGKYHYPVDIVKEVNNYTIETNADKTKYNPEVIEALENKDFYYSSTLNEKKGTIVKNSLLVVLEKVKYDNKVNYLVITDYSTNQKAWISSDNTKVIKKDLLSINLSDNGSFINVFNKPNGSVLQKAYSGNFLPIVDKEVSNGKTYLKVVCKVVGTITYGYVDSSIDGIKYTLDFVNLAPVIEAYDTSILEGSSFDPLDGVRGTDYEDGDITEKIKVVKNTVDTKKIGEYEVNYELTDNYGNKVSKKIKVVVVGRVKSDALFMYESLKHTNGNKFKFQGFMGIKGMDNKEVVTTLILKNQVTNKEYRFKLDKWNDYPYEMSSLDDDKAYDYSGGWFTSEIDLSSNVIPNGDYTIYVETINGDKVANSLFTNIAYMDMTRRVKGNSREFLIEVDYSTYNSPILFSIRDSLISLDVPKTYDPMYNFFNNLSLDNNKLSIKGTSHNVSVNFGVNDNVERKIVFEEKDTFKRYEMDLGSITDGDYPITLAVSDNCDKTRAWYNNTVDLSQLPTGNYIIYIKNKVNNITYYGELIDVAYTDFSKINNSEYEFNRNDNVRLRVELKVKAN